MYSTSQPSKKKAEQEQQKKRQRLMITGGSVVAAIVALILVLMFFSGSKNETSERVYTSQEIMEDVAAMYKEYATDKKASPKQLSDFSLSYEPTHVLGFAHIRDGDVVVLWGGSLTAGGNRVVAYEKKVPESGGFVAFQDGTVKEMTAEEFKAAQKIK